MNYAMLIRIWGNTNFCETSYFQPSHTEITAQKHNTAYFIRKRHLIQIRNKTKGPALYLYNICVSLLFSSRMLSSNLCAFKVPTRVPRVYWTRCQQHFARFQPISFFWQFISNRKVQRNYCIDEHTRNVVHRPQMQLYTCVFAPLYDWICWMKLKMGQIQLVYTGYLTSMWRYLLIWFTAYFAKLLSIYRRCIGLIQPYNWYDVQVGRMLLSKHFEILVLEVHILDRWYNRHLLENVSSNKNGYDVSINLMESKIFCWQVRDTRLQVWSRCLLVDRQNKRCPVERQNVKRPAIKVMRY